MTPPARFLNPATLPPPLGFSHVVDAPMGRLIVISGQVPRDTTGAVVGIGDFRAQVAQVFANLTLALAAAGATWRHVVKLQYYCTTAVPPDALPGLRDVRDRHLNLLAPPASTFLFVPRLLHPDWLIEIDAWAVVA